MKWSVKGIVLTALIAIKLHKIGPSIFPHGYPEYIKTEDHHVYGTVDKSNKSLMGQSGKLAKIYERRDVSSSSKNQKSPSNTNTTPAALLLKGHETILFDPKGQMYVLTEQSKLVKIVNIKETTEAERNDLDSNPSISSSSSTPSSAMIVTYIAETVEIADLGVGRPLGGAFDSTGSYVYVADAILGLIGVQMPKTKKQKAIVELLASKVQLNDGTWSSIVFADDVAIGPKTGLVYFTDASSIAPDRLSHNDWDVIHAAKLNILQNSKTGRLLRYDPSTGKVDILASGISFANGVAVNKEETFVLMAETVSGKILKYNLESIDNDESQQSKTGGTLEVLVDQLLGYPDGMDCSHKTGKCYAVMPVMTKPVRSLAKLPPMLNLVLRGLMMIIPRSFYPEIKTGGCVVELDPEEGKLLRVLLDPEGDDISDLTGVTVNGDKLYFGSLRNDYIGVYNMS